MKVVLAIILALIFYGGGFALGYWSDHRAPVYEGIEVFETQDEFTTFKADMAHPKVKIRRISVIRTEPIIVDFEVTLPQDVEFNYGQIHYDKDGRILLPIALGTMFTFFACLAIWRRDSAPH